MAHHEDASMLNLEKKNTLTVVNTNARSLCPKTESLIDCFGELSVDIAIITETWLKVGPELDQFSSDFELGAGLSSLHLCRDPNPVTGVAHGGVSIINKKCAGKFREYAHPNPENFEILAAVGNFHGTARKVIIIAVYIPPQLYGSQGERLSGVS